MKLKGPQTKGMLLVSVVADVVRLVNEGRITREDLESALSPEVRKLVDTGVSPVSWYECDVYPQLARLLMLVDGRGLGDLEYIRARGQRAGERLIESGLYQQLDYMKRAVENRKGGRVDREDFQRSMRLVVSMQAALMNGGRWGVEPDPDHPDRFMIAIDGVEGLSEESAVATWGILTGITIRSGSGFQWVYERPAPGRILYRMDRDLGRL